MKPYVPGREYFPGLGPHPGFPEHEQYEMRIPEKLLREVSGKIVRGCEYVLGKGRIIENPYAIGVHFAGEEKIGDVIRLFDRLGAVHLGPGFRVKRAIAHDDPNAVLYKIDIWGTWTIYASILQRPHRQTIGHGPSNSTETRSQPYELPRHPGQRT
jgi:hypothetical protein